MFLVAAIYPTFTYGDEPAKWTASGGDELAQSTDEHRKSLWRLVEGAVRGPWFLGGRRSALDLYVSVMTPLAAAPRVVRRALSEAARDRDARSTPTPRLAGVWATNSAAG